MAIRHFVCNKPFFSLLIGFLGLTHPSALAWELVPLQDQSLGSATQEDDPFSTPAGHGVWQSVTPGEEYTQDAIAHERDEAEAAREAVLAAIPPPPPPITGGLYQISRGEQGLPSITQRLPSGYGSKFLGFQAGLFLESCNVSGNYVCGSENFFDEFNNQGKGDVTFNVGLGDPVRFVGIDLGYNFTSLATTRPGQEDEGTGFGEGQGINLAISRNITPDVAIKVGAINLIELDENQPFSCNCKR